MADDKVSRREFIRNTSMAATTVVAGVAARTAGAQGAEEYVQSDYAVRTKALVSVLTRKNLVNPATMDAVVDFYENKVGPHIGARVVARSWVDPDYRQRLLADARAVAREDNLTGVQGTDLVVLENTPEVHNLVVCTLCSCYPWPLLGLPPSWYRTRPIGLRRSSIRAACCKNSGSNSMITWKCGYGTAPRRCVISSFPSARPGQRA